MAGHEIVRYLQKIFAGLAMNIADWMHKAAAIAPGKWKDMLYSGAESMRKLGQAAILVAEDESKKIDRIVADTHNKLRDRFATEKRNMKDIEGARKSFIEEMDKEYEAYHKIRNELAKPPEVAPIDIGDLAAKVAIGLPADGAAVGGGRVVGTFSGAAAALAGGGPRVMEDQLNEMRRQTELQEEIVKNTGRDQTLTLG